MHLQHEMTSTDVYRVAAVLHASWRCHNAVTPGRDFASTQDMAGHFKSIIEDPWIHGAVSDTCQKDRRRERIRAPPALQGTHVYNSDGASRAPQDCDREGSCGVAFSINDRICARLALYMGDVTNNVAEFKGFICAMEHCRSHARALGTDVCFRVDSLLVQRQVTCIWQCKHTSLQGMVEQCWSLLNEIRAGDPSAQVWVEHVYREFNVEADGLANEAIDSYVPAMHQTGVVVNDRWIDESMS